MNKEKIKQPRDILQAGTEYTTPDSKRNKPRDHIWLNQLVCNLLQQRYFYFERVSIIISISDGIKRNVYMNRLWYVSSGVPRNFVRGGGFQQIQLRTEDRENRDLGAVAP